MLEPGNNEALKIETCRRIQDLRECRPALSELVGIETDEQNGKGKDWSGQADCEGGTVRRFSTIAVRSK